MPTLRDTFSGVVFLSHQHDSFQHSYFNHHLLHTWPFLSLFAPFVMDRFECKGDNDSTLCLLELLDLKDTKCQKREQQAQILPVLFSLKFYPSLQFHTISHNFTCPNKPPKIRAWSSSLWFANQLSCTMSKFEYFAEIKSVQILFRHRINHFDKWNK